MKRGVKRESQILEGFKQKIRPNRGFIAISVLSILASFIFAHLSVMKYEAMHASAYDLGLYGQIMYETMHGHLFFTNLLGQSYLSEHFSPIVFLILIPYALHQSIVTLLWIQAFGIGLGGIPLYLLSKEWIVLTVPLDKRNRVYLNLFPLVITASYLLSPMVTGPLTFDFHIMTLLPLFVFWQFYFFLKRSKLGTVVFLILITALHHNFVFITLTILLAEYLVFRKGRYYGRNYDISLKDKKSLYYFSIFITAVLVLFVYYYAASYAKPLFSGLPPDLTGPSTGQTGAISDSVIGLVGTLFTRPDLILSFIALNGGLKSLFLAFAIFPTAMVSLIFPEFLIASIPYLMYGMLSSYSAYYTIGYQYSMMIIPMVFVATVGGFVRLMTLQRRKGVSLYKNKPKTQSGVALVILILLSVGAIGGFTYSPASPPSTFNQVGIISNLWNEHPGSSALMVQNISNNIPANSFVLTQNNIFPFFANNINSYSTPWSPGYSVNNTSKFAYMIVEYGNYWSVATSANSSSMFSMVNKALFTGHFGIYAEGHNVLAIAKNYTNAPIEYTPLTSHFSETDLLFISSNGTFYLKQGEALPISHFGPFFTTNKLILMPGKYNLTVHYKVPTNYYNNSFSLKVNAGNTSASLGNETITPGASWFSNGLYSQSINFNLKVTYDNIVFNGTENTVPEGLVISSLDLQQTAP